jgi:hypothetical protein
MDLWRRLLTVLSLSFRPRPALVLAASTQHTQAISALLCCAVVSQKADPILEPTDGNGALFHSIPSNRSWEKVVHCQPSRGTLTMA